MADDDDSAVEVRNVISAVEVSDGSYIILELELKGAPSVSFAFPTEQIGPLVAMLVQAAAKAYAVAGELLQQRALEAVGSEVHRAGGKTDIHFRLAGGLDLPIGLTTAQAAALREQLAASLAQGSHSPGPTRQ